MTDHPSTQQPFKLQHVTLIMRHGLRTPIASFPSDPRVVWTCNSTEVHSLEQNPGLFFKQRHQGNEHLGGNCYEGALTSLGQDQITALGQQLRKRYIETADLLSPVLNPSQIYVRSTDVRRTIHTASLLLSGLYPNSPPATVTMEVMSSGAENMYARSRCVRIRELKEALRATSLWQEREAAMEPVRERLHAYFPANLLTRPSWAGLHNTLYTLQQHGFAETLALDPALLDQVSSHAGWIMRERFNDPTIHRLSIGRFANDLLAHIEAAPAALKFSLFSGHDLTVAPLLGVLGIYREDHVPRPSANIALELHQDQAADRYVRVLYNGEVEKLPACGSVEFCPWSQFSAILRAAVPANYEAECRSQATLTTNPSPSPSPSPTSSPSPNPSPSSPATTP